MTKVAEFLSLFPDDEKEVLYNLVAFPDFFSVDWFSGNINFLPSKLFTVVMSLDKKSLISIMESRAGFYEWTSKFPRDEFIQTIPSHEMSFYYRKAVEIFRNNLPKTEETMVRIAHQCLLAGIEPSDLDTIFRAALIEEKNHKISAAIKLYNAILEYAETVISVEPAKPSHDLLYIFIKAIERRALLSVFDPDIKKLNRLLCEALDAALYLDDRRAQASLQLLIGQNNWMFFQYERAIHHFDQGWKIIQGINDPNLYKRGLQLQGLSFWLKGRTLEAVRAYEESLGEMESFANDDFSNITALHLALSYTQIGMPQRGLGISETIFKRAQKHENWPLVANALITMGKILLEIRQLNISQTYFGRALELSRNENLPMQEAMAGFGLSNIECLQGNYETAAEHYKVVWKIRKSSWYHILNLYHLFDTGYMLHAQNAFSPEMNPVFNFLNQLKVEQLNPFLHGLIKRLDLMFLRPNMPAKEKIQQLIETEKSVRQSGETFELAKLRIDIATLSLQINDWQSAEYYGKKAWEFLKPIAKDVFPANLKYLISDENITDGNQLFDLIVEMGEALANHTNIEQLLTNIISSISRLMGTERTALFIKDKESPEIKLVASRNLMKEQITDHGFKKNMDKIQEAANSVDGKIIKYEIADSGPGGIRYVVITPLMLNKQVAGVLYQDSRFYSFDANADKFKLLYALGTQIAVSIDRANAYDQIAHLNKRLIEENRYYKEEKDEFRPFGEIIGTSDQILQVQRLIKKVAPTTSTVLINGETGVGKELIARAIHRESERHDGPFIRVNCAALPDTLIDSELFGHEKGAFTGAIKTKAGRFELANEGTIFLDEVSELPLSTQSRLLRVLQEKEFQRVGGMVTIHSDFRLITASNKDLENEVAQGKFRADLYYRLNVFPLHVPSLRERKEDIPLLATHFLSLFCSQLNKGYEGIPESEMKKLLTYHWPGNIRELSNMVERAVILGGPYIRFVELEGKPVTMPEYEEFMDIKDFDKIQIMQALEKTRGKIGGKDGAASLLGLKRTTLIHRMKRLGISVEKSVS